MKKKKHFTFLSRHLKSRNTYLDLTASKTTISRNVSITVDAERRHSMKKAKFKPYLSTILALQKTLEGNLQLNKVKHIQENTGINVRTVHQKWEKTYSTTAK